MSSARAAEMLRPYTDFMLRNREALSTAEKYVDTALWLASYHFEEAEVAIELAQSGISLVSYYHDLLLSSSSSKRSPSWNPFSITLNHITRFEVLFEIILSRREIDPCFYIVGLEAIKVWIRYCILRKEKWEVFLEVEVEPSVSDTESSEIRPEVINEDGGIDINRKIELGEIIYTMRPFIYGFVCSTDP